MSYRNNSINFDLVINKQGYVYETNSFYEGYILPKELKKLKKAIDKTIELYKSKGLTEKKIKDYARKKSDERELQYEEQRRLNKLLPKEKPPIIGDLYLIHDSSSDVLKIGYTKNIENRLSSLQSATSHKLELLYLITGHAYREKEVHALFDVLRLSQKGEWFKYDNSIIDYFKSLKSEAA